MDEQVYYHFINHGCGNVVIAAVSWAIILSSINPWRHIGISTTNGVLRALVGAIVPNIWNSGTVFPQETACRVQFLSQGSKL